MQGIVSIQSHVAYGYVGNKAATYPLQSLGFDVWPINTVQFSNHTGYGKWQGEIFSAEHIINVAEGIFKIGKAHECQAILTGYMGSAEICDAVIKIVKKFKQVNKKLLYLCDPVMGNEVCYVKPEVVEFFKANLTADILTPNRYEAELLSGITIKTIDDLHKASSYFHKKGIKIVIITGIKLKNNICVFASNMKNGYLIQTPEIMHGMPINGTGDLFSSTFLGIYLRNGDLVNAVQHASFFLQSAINKTIENGMQELQVLSIKYKILHSKILPKVQTFDLP